MLTGSKNECARRADEGNKGPWFAALPLSRTRAGPLKGGRDDHSTTLGHTCSVLQFCTLLREGGQRYERFWIFIQSRTLAVAMVTLAPQLAPCAAMYLFGHEIARFKRTARSSRPEPVSVQHVQPPFSQCIGVAAIFTSYFVASRAFPCRRCCLAMARRSPKTSSEMTGSLTISGWMRQPGLKKITKRLRTASSNASKALRKFCLSQLELRGPSTRNVQAHDLAQPVPSRVKGTRLVGAPAVFNCNVGAFSRHFKTECYLNANPRFLIPKCCCGRRDPL